MTKKKKNYNKGWSNVRITPDNVHRIARYRDKQNFAPSIQAIVNFAVQQFVMKEPR